MTLNSNGSNVFKAFVLNCLVLVLCGGYFRV